MALLDVILGYDCNVFCDYCTITPGMRTRSLPAAAVAAELARGAADGFDAVSFTGGEPTIRPDLLPLIRSAREYPLFSLNTGNQETISFEKALLEFERALLSWAFEKAEQNQGRAAKLLGIPRSTFQYRWTAAFGPQDGAEAG